MLLVKKGSIPFERLCCFDTKEQSGAMHSLCHTKSHRSMEEAEIVHPLCTCEKSFGRQVARFLQEVCSQKCRVDVDLFVEHSVSSRFMNCVANRCA